MRSKMLYTTTDVLHALPDRAGNDMKRERLREWITTRDYIKTLTPSPGQGKVSLFDRGDIYALAVFKHLIDDLHIQRDYAGKMVSQWFKPRKPEEVVYVGFFKKDNSHHWITVNYNRRAQLLTVMPEGDAPLDPAVIIHFERIRKEVDARLPD